MTNTLPKPTEPLIDGSARMTRSWYNYLRGQIGESAVAALQAQIDALWAAINEDDGGDVGQIFGQLSVQVVGNLEDGAYLQLRNDLVAPGNTYYYGTGPEGSKGWYTVASALVQGAGITLTVNADGTIDIAHADTSSVADISANFTGGTVPGEISLTFDQFGHVLSRNITGRTLDHNDTGALQGGNSTERYHFTAAEHTGLLPWASESPDDYEPAFAKGDLIAGTNITLAGALTGRLVGSGNVTIDAAGGGGSGTVTSVDIDDATGITFAGGPVTTSGVFTPALSANLQAWHGLATSAKQDTDSDLTAIAGANPAANQSIYWTGAGTVSTYSLTAGGRALGGVAGTANTAPYFSAANTVTLQAVSASGRALWNIGSTAFTMPFQSAANTWILTPVSSFALGLLDDGDAATARDTLGVSFRGALVSLTAAESIPDNTNTAVPFDAESYDIGGWWVVGSPTRLTVPSGVTLVRVTAGVFFNTNATGQRLMRLFKNGAAVIGGFSERQDACSALSSDMSAASAVLQVTAGDYFEMIVNQNSGAALNLLDSGTGTWMCIEALAD